MARSPKPVAAAAGDEQSQADQAGNDTPPVSTPEDTSGTPQDDQASNDEAQQGEGALPGADAPADPAAGDQAAASDAPAAPAGGDQAPASDGADAAAPGEPKPAEPVVDDVEVRVLVAYDDREPNDVIVMTRAEAAMRVEQVDADPTAVAYAKSLRS